MPQSREPLARHFQRARQPLKGRGRPEPTGYAAHQLPRVSAEEAAIAQPIIDRYSLFRRSAISRVVFLERLVLMCPIPAAWPEQGCFSAGV